MNSGGQLPWGNRKRGSFDAPGRGNNPLRIAVMGAIVLLLALGSWFVLGRACSASCDDLYCAASLGVGAPDGFVFASDVYRFTGDNDELSDGQTATIAIELSERATTSANLSFYRFIEDISAWEQVGPASLSEDGTRVSGDFQSLPETLVVMRRLAASGQVLAYLNPGQQLHPDAAATATTILTRDFIPVGDGTLQGTLSQPPLQPGQVHLPVLSAAADVEGSLANLDAILSSSSNRSTHVRRIVESVTTFDLQGISIDYRDLRADQRISFALFVEELGIELRAQGKTLHVIAPAPIRTTERVDEGAYDWAAIGRAADIASIAPIRDQSTYRTDLPVILAHLGQQLDLRKVVLTVTPLAAERSPQGVRALTLAEAMTIATAISISDSQVTTNENVELVGVNIDKSEGLSGLVWDEAAATVGFTYKLDGGRTVWIENHFSVAFKLEFVSAYQLAGFGVEDSSDNQFLGNIWTAIVPFVQSGRPVLLRPNQADLEPRWTVSAGSLEGGQGGVARWTSPSEPGSYSISLSLSDGVYRFDSQINVNVQPRDAAGAGGG